MTFRTTCLTPPRALLAIAALAIALLVQVGVADAATVANTNDSGPGSLRQTIADAGPGDTINVPAGTYVLTSGPLDFSTNLKIHGAGSAATTISGNDQSGIFFLLDPNQEQVVEITGMTLRDGRVNGIENDSESFMGQEGAAIDASNFITELALHDVVITENVAETTAVAPEEFGFEGGILSFSGRSLVMTDSRVIDNTVRSTGDGRRRAGTILGGAVLSSSTNTRIEGSEIADNLVDARGGPGQPGGKILGAGVLVAPEPFPGEGEGELRIAATTIADNTALTTNGGGIAGGYAQGGGLAILSTTSVKNHLADDTITGNEVKTTKGGYANGGGLAVVSILGSTSVGITSSTIASNSAVEAQPDGTPGYHQTPAGIVSGGNVYATGNYFLTGTHDYDGQTLLTFANTIVSGGIAPPGTGNCAVAAGQAPLRSVGFNLDSGSGCGFHSFGDLANKNPLLGPLTMGGGHTKTMSPVPGSPVIDQGAAFGLRTDQRGLPNPVDFSTIANTTAGDRLGSDIGAVELQSLSSER